MKDKQEKCSMCHGTSFWVSIHERVICGRCHPPVDESRVKEWLDISETDQKEVA